MLNALEGKRANPRAKPPFPQVSGLWGKPTIVNNVETLATCLTSSTTGLRGSRSLSRSKDAGTKLYGASGKVKRPGLWELPMGTTMREILEEHAGGMRDGLRFRGVLPGGASTDFLVEATSGRAHGLHRSTESGQPPGDRHHDRARRSDLSCRHGLEPESLFCAGVLRLVYTVLERPELGETDSESDGGRRRKTWRSGEAWRFKRSFGRPVTRFAHWRQAQRSLCRAR